MMMIMTNIFIIQIWISSLRGFDLQMCQTPQTITVLFKLTDILTTDLTVTSDMACLATVVTAYVTTGGGHHTEIHRFTGIRTSRHRVTVEVEGASVIATVKRRILVNRTIMSDSNTNGISQGSCLSLTYLRTSVTVRQTTHELVA